jgi:tetratricopeptide (TPR) repeat protein
MLLSFNLKIRRKMEEKLKILSKINYWTLVGLVFFLPLFFLPLTTNFFFFNKVALLAMVTFGLLAIGVVKSFFLRRISVTFTFLDLPVFFVAFVTLLSSLLKAPNSQMALAGEGGVILLLTVFYFVLTNGLTGKGQKRRVELVLASLGSGLVLSVFTVLQVFGLGARLFKGTFLASTTFSPTGSLLSTFIFLIIVLASGVGLLLRGEKSGQRATAGVLAGINLAGAVVAGYGLFWVFKSQALFLPLKASWHVAIESFREAPLLGVGPGRFLVAFTRFRPLFLNQTSFWQLRFLNSGTYFFQVLTTTGFLGILGWLWLVFLALNGVAKRSLWSKESLFWSPLLAVGASVILEVLLPFQFVVLFAAYFFLGILASGRGRRYSFNLGSLPTNLDFAGRFVLILVLVGVGAGSWWIGRVYLSDYFFQRSLEAWQRNQGVEAYNFQQRAIGKFPYSADLRIAYSRTNLALASALASQENLVSQDQNNLVRLVQQAVREARSATLLDEEQILAWENLAQVYRNLINLAQGAESWAQTGLQAAIRLDPNNPRTYLGMGGLFYSLGSFDRAADYFRQAAVLKPDWSNAYFNWALALESQGNLAVAKLAYERTLALLPVESSDREPLREKIDALETSLRGAAPVESGGVLPPVPEEAGMPLTEPEPLPSPPAGVEEEIELPEEEAPALPTPTESAAESEVEG